MARSSKWAGRRDTAAAAPAVTRTGFDSPRGRRRTQPPSTEPRRRQRRRHGAQRCRRPEAGRAAGPGPNAVLRPRSGQRGGRCQVRRLLLHAALGPAGAGTRELTGRTQREEKGAQGWAGAAEAASLPLPCPEAVPGVGLGCA